MKKWNESGTFWGALTIGITAIGKIAVAASTGDVMAIGNGVLVLLGAFTAWRLRKGQGVSIEQ